MNRRHCLQSLLATALSVACSKDRSAGARLRPSAGAPEPSSPSPETTRREGSSAAASGTPTEPEPIPVVYLQPLGPELPAEDVAFVETSLQAFYDVTIERLERIPLPKSAYTSKRARYRAEKLLPVLEARRPEDGFRILGLTARDISTTKGKHDDWGILGLASIDGRACVLSSFRAKRGAKSTTHARVRLGKVAVHEIGHTLGLTHCPNEGCLMEDAKGTVATTDREFDLCSDCRRRLIRRGHELADSDVPIPWPEVG